MTATKPNLEVDLEIDVSISLTSSNWCLMGGCGSFREGLRINDAVASKITTRASGVRYVMEAQIKSNLRPSLNNYTA